MDSASRRLLSMRIESDPQLRQRFDDLVARLRELVAEPHTADADVLSNAMAVAIDLEPPRPPRLRDGNPHRPSDPRDEHVQYHVRTYAVAAADRGMRQEDLEIKYSVLHVLQWLKAGITLSELERLGLPEVWPTISE